MKKKIFIITMIFLSFSLYSIKENHSLQANIKQKEIVSRGYIYETGYLYEDESDYYSINCGSGYITLDLSVGSDADIDLYLYDSNGGDPVASSNDYGYGVNEYLSYNGQPDIYTIEVYCYEVDPDGGYDYNYTLDGTFPDPGDPDLIISSIIINKSPEPDGVVYTEGWDPCSVTVTIQNTGNANASSFDVALLYNDAETGWEELLATEYISALNAGSTDNIVFDYYDFDEDIYMYHDGIDPAKVKLFAKVDYYNAVTEEDEDNNYSSETGWIYFIEQATYDNYGWCAGTTFISGHYYTAGVFCEARSGNRFHNGIDICCNNNDDCYSISSGEIYYTYEGQNGQNSYISMKSYENQDRRFVYVHIHEPQNVGYYRNSGIKIAQENYPDNNHIHFKDKTDTSSNGPDINPLRSNGINYPLPDGSPPSIACIKMFESGTPNWSSDPIGQSGQIYQINVQIFDQVDIVAHVYDDLGSYHGGSATGIGIYSIGYKIKNSSGTVIINEPDRMIFNYLPLNSDFK